MGASWVSGMRLYGCVATLGLLGRYGLADLPGQLTVLQDWWVIGVAGGLFVVEFFADKVPWLDSLWDAVHSFIRIPAGAALAFAGFADTDPRVQVVAALVGGGAALAAHGTKASLRAGANLSPEPVSNVTLSLAEDGVAAGSTFAAVFVPVLAIVIVVVGVAVAVWLLPKAWRAASRLRGRAGPG